MTVNAIEKKNKHTQQIRGFIFTGGFKGDIKQCFIIRYDEGLDHLLLKREEKKKFAFEIKGQ